MKRSSRRRQVKRSAICWMAAALVAAMLLPSPGSSFVLRPTPIIIATHTGSSLSKNAFHAHQSKQLLQVTSTSSSSSDIFEGEASSVQPPPTRQEQEQRRRQQPPGQNQQQQQQQQQQQKDAPEWKFFDTARIHVAGGDGGNGCVAFRREKGEARGGPNGGRGGSGGSVYIVCDETLNTLASLRRTGRVHVRGASGNNGLGKNKDGCKGRDVYVRVPPGTIVRELTTQKLAGELLFDGTSSSSNSNDKDNNKNKDESSNDNTGRSSRRSRSRTKSAMLVAKGGRGGRGNFAFQTSRNTTPRLAERGEPGAARWLSLELRLVADVGFLGMPNAGKSTLLAAASAARPKIADYPFTTVIPNLGVCDLENDDDSTGGTGTGGKGLVLCDIPGLIEGAAHGVGMGGAFLRHVQRCKVLLHVVDGTSKDPIQDFLTIQAELKEYDERLARKPQVVVLNKLDVPEVQEQEEALLAELREKAGHSRVLAISAATTKNVRQLMQRLRKFVDAQEALQDEHDDDPLADEPRIDLSRAGLEYESDDFAIQSDPSYPGQWRVSGDYIEQVARMTHWEYPEAVERFGRQMQALGIRDALLDRGADEGDLIMIDKYDFDFAPDLRNPYIPETLLEQDRAFFAADGSPIPDDRVGTEWKSEQDGDGDDDERTWRPFRQGGFLDMDVDELEGFGEDAQEDWDSLMEDSFPGGDDDDFVFYPEEEDSVWTSS